jgi:iron complex transport system ATP-binding protein
MSDQAIISAKSIGIGYAKNKHARENTLYTELSFELYKGELVCLLGSNGAGKSTLLRTISASQPILNGRIQFFEKDLTEYTEKELSQLLGLVLTDKTSAGGLLVSEMVEMGRYPYTGFFGQLSKGDKDIAQTAMVNVGISHKANSYIAELSDGERQKAMIAKALAQECPVILLDEPTAFLDIESRIDIINLLHHLALDHGKTILLSTHDIDLALLLADRLWLLSREKGMVSGVTEDIVLSGFLDNFFKEEKVVFRKESGNFLPNRNSDKKVHLKADDIYYYWTKNMLERYGYALTEDIADSLFSVIVEPNNQIEVQIEDKVFEYTGFNNLGNFLKEYFNKSFVL